MNLILQSAFISISIYCALQVIIFKVFAPTKRWEILKNLFLITTFIFCFLTYHLLKQKFKYQLNFSDTEEVIGAFLLYILFGFGYLIFYITIERSISLRTLEEFEAANKETINMDYLLELYSPKVALERRLNILCENSYLKKTENGFQLTSKGKLIAIIAHRVKNFLRLGLGG